MIATAYIVIKSHATITSIIANIALSIAIKNVAAMFHNIMRNNAAAMFHSTIAKHAAANVHNITILANANIAQSILVNVAANMSQSTTISMYANQHALLTAVQKHVNCVSYCQTGGLFRLSDSLS